MAMLLLAVIYLSFISLGLPDSLLGSAWPTVSHEFGLPVSYMGIVSMIISGGTIVSSLLSERLTKKLGTKNVVTASIFLTAAALFGFSLSSRFFHLCLWGIPYGLGAGAIDAALNNYVSLHYSSRHMSWLHCFWGVGTIISPYIMSYALIRARWQSGYRWVSVIQFCIFAAVLLAMPLWNIHKNEDTAENSRITGLRGTLKIKGVPFLLLGFFSYCSAEATAMLWTSSYLAAERGVSKETAAAFGSLFFIGITAGRFLSGFISDKLGDRAMIRCGAAIALFGTFLVFLPVKADIFALAGFIVIGLGCAPVYPSIIHSTPANFGAENSQAIIGVQMASAYLGSTFMPPLFGVLGSLTTLGIMPFFMAAFLILMITMTEKTFSQNSKDGGTV